MWLQNTYICGRRERTYRMSEASYARLMAATSAQLEQSSAGALRGLTSLQCVKCQSIFSQVKQHQHIIHTESFLVKLKM